MVKEVNLPPNFILCYVRMESSTDVATVTKGISFANGRFMDVLYYLDIGSIDGAYPVLIIHSRVVKV